MVRNFSTTIAYGGRSHLAVLIPTLRRNGMHYEVNIEGFPRFWVRWGAMERYEVTRPADARIPDELAIAISDAIEREGERH